MNILNNYYVMEKMFLCLWNSKKKIYIYVSFYNFVYYFNFNFLIKIVYLKEIIVFI